MGLKDRLLDAVASLFAPTMDHPTRGGMTGDGEQTGDGGEDENDRDRTE